MLNERRESTVLYPKVRHANHLSLGQQYSHRANAAYGNSTTAVPQSQTSSFNGRFSLLYYYVASFNMT